MIKKSNHNKFPKPEPRTQKSHDQKPSKLQRNESSSVPYRQISVNKENVHPNKNINKQQPQYSQKGYRNIYYDMKQSRQNINLQKYPLQNKICSQKQVFSPANTYYRPIVKQIQIKISNRSLEKCQIHPYKANANAQYIINQSGNDLLCCGQCSNYYKNRVSIEKISQQIVGAGLTIRQYYRLITNKLDALYANRQNLLEYEKQFRSILNLQITKQEQYYYQLIQVIQNSMNETKKTLTKYLNYGCETIFAKHNQIKQQIQFLQIQFNKLTKFQSAKRDKLQYKKQNQFQFKHIFKQIQTKIELPIIDVFTELPDIKQNFQKLFNQKYSIKILTQEQIKLWQQRKQQQLMRQVSQFTSYQSYNQTGRQSQQDLFCDQEFGEGKTNKTHEFSFDQSNEGDVVPTAKTDCILELVQQEDVISPVFKVI